MKYLPKDAAFKPTFGMNNYNSIIELNIIQSYLKTWCIWIVLTLLLWTVIKIIKSKRFIVKLETGQNQAFVTKLCDSAIFFSIELGETLKPSLCKVLKMHSKEEHWMSREMDDMSRQVFSDFMLLSYGSINREWREIQWLSQPEDVVEYQTP